MFSLIFTVLIFSVLTNPSLAQINNNNKKLPLNKVLLLKNDGLEKKVIVPLKLLMSGQHECPRLQNLGSKLLNDPHHCDIELQVVDRRLNESRVFCAHKAILCMRSSVLNEKITELLKKHQGPQKPRLRIEGQNPDIFQYILQYLYTDKIDPNFDVKRNIMDLYVAADYAKLPELNVMIKEYLYDSVNTNDVSNYLKWANKYGRNDIKHFLLDITRTALNMNKVEWQQFVKSMCESNREGNGKISLDTIINPIVKPINEAVQPLSNLNFNLGY